MGDRDWEEGNSIRGRCRGVGRGIPLVQAKLEPDWRGVDDAMRVAVECPKREICG